VTKRGNTQTTHPAGWFSEPVRAGFPPNFESQLHVDPKTKRFETDYARQQRIRESSGWGTLPWHKERAL
jgi:hypothetical protein